MFNSQSANLYVLQKNEELTYERTTIIHNLCGFLIKILQCYYSGLFVCIEIIYHFCLKVQIFWENYKVEKIFHLNLTSLSSVKSKWKIFFKFSQAFSEYLNFIEQNADIMHIRNIKVCPFIREKKMQTKFTWPLPSQKGKKNAFWPLNFHSFDHLTRNSKVD